MKRTLQKLGFLKHRALYFTLLVCGMSLSQNLSAQLAAQYTFSEFSSTYTPITGTTTTASGDDGIQDGIPIGFSFNFCGTNYTTFSVSTNGFMKFGSAIVTGTPNYSNNLGGGSNSPLVAGFWDDNSVPSGVGSIQYLVQGNPGLRTLTVQWTNMVFSTSGTSPSMDFQIILHENGEIDIVYGGYTSTASRTAAIGIESTASGDFNSVTPGTPSTASTTVADNSVTLTTGVLLSGTTYKFTPPACTGTPPVPTTNPSGTQTICYGATLTLQAILSTTASNMWFQWQESTNGGTSWNDIPGAVAPSYGASPLSSTMYRVKDSCGNSNLISVSNPVTINVLPQAAYLPIPYYQDFETWGNNCGTSDVPVGGNWNNQPSTGDQSWRRVNQGTTAGWTNALGAYSPASLGGGTGSARFHSYSSSPGVPGNLDLYLDLSDIAYWGDKQLYFYHINGATAAASGADSLTVWISTNGGGAFVPLGSYDTAATWRRRSLAISSNTPGVNSNSSQTIIRFQGKSLTSANTTDIGIDSVAVVGPCSGTPVAGTVTGLPSSLCAGSFVNLSTVGTTMAGGLTYQWEQSVDGTSWSPAAGGIGATTLFYTTPSLYDTIYYRMTVGCGGSMDATAAVRLDVQTPFYASVPYEQNFENWVSGCSSFDLPDSNWANSLPTSNNSWRKNNQYTAGWATPTAGQYTTQPSVSGVNAARFHSAYAPAGSTAQLDLLVDCSQQPGNKQLEFHYRNDSGTDSLEILYSIDSGFHFTALDTLYTTSQWQEYRMPLVSNSAKTIIRFKGYSDYSTTAGSDINIDSVRVVEPCSAPVSAGLINNVISACKNAPFLLYLTGNTQAAGLTYDWESSPDNTTWSSTGGTSYNYTATITRPTFFRAVVSCVASGLRDTTPVQFVDTTQFYYCYCANGATVVSGADVGNVLLESLPGNVKKLNNGTYTTLTNNAAANKSYTDFRYNTAVPVPELYWDTTYRISVTQINSSAFTAAQATVWIDKDHSGTFDAGEIVLQKTTSASTSPAQLVSDNFVLPTTMDTGITGMRVQLVEGGSGTPVPCLSYTGGETEDYLVKILYPPCDGAPNAGTAVISDSSTCIGYTIFVTDTTYDRVHSGLMSVWEQSPDGFSWAPVPGSAYKDHIAHVVTARTYFRMRMICATPVKLDTSYSNVVMVDVNPPVSCYCLSYADGGKSDTSDIGEFKFETFSNNVQGPHVKNPEAWRLRTDYTRQQPPELWIDSSYSFRLYHILSSVTHGDAKVTIFIDYDADMEYEAPQELVYTGYTSASNYLINGTITIPHNALPDVPTGMRVILNNDVNANLPSDEGCGAYTSGETEDYVVIIRSPQTDVRTVRKIGHYSLFPNPTEGRFTVSFTMLKGSESATLRVTNMVGSEVLSRDLGSVNGSTTYQEHLDLTKMARGVYMVELRAGEERMIRKLVVQ